MRTSMDGGMDGSGIRRGSSRGSSSPPGRSGYNGHLMTGRWPGYGPDPDNSGAEWYGAVDGDVMGSTSDTLSDGGGTNVQVISAESS